MLERLEMRVFRRTDVIGNPSKTSTKQVYFKSTPKVKSETQKPI